ncbi:MAG: tetratricopeptide repeat protein [Proteobacteria bacterium]|nr:tetratricopeptide repeat protein [Pseudomonadota bacterium]
MSDVLARALNSHQEGRLHEAKTLYRQVLAVEPDNSDALHYMGVLCLQNDDCAEAVRLIERALALNPGNADALNNLGQAFAGLDRWPDAEAAYRKALAMVPDFAPAHSNLGDALMRQGKPEAAASYQTALRAYPGDPDILVSLGRALAMQEQFEEAIGHFRQALEALPDDAMTLTNLGNALQAAGRPDEAVSVFERAIAVQPDLVEAHFNLGLALYDQDRLEESIASYQRVLALDPENIDAHHHLGPALFLQGRLAEGWQEYEWRWRSEKGLNLRNFPQPPWQGAALKGKTVLVWSEQGVGDQISFAGMVPDLLERGATVVLECDARLAPLFERSFPGVECLAKENPPSLETQRQDIDFQVPGGGLGRLLRPDYESFHRRPFYLIADNQRRDVIRKRYQDGQDDQGGDAGLLVGISWESKNKRVGDLKSMPLEGFQPLTVVSGVTFVDLQYGNTVEERRNFEEKTGVSLIHDNDVDQLADLDLFAAQVAAMDLVISVSSTTVHVSGGLGIPTWVMLNTTPFNCWMLERDVSPWYPSVRLFRQKQPGVWGDVVERVASELEHVGSIRR